MESKEHEDKFEDTGIGSTFALKQEECVADITDQDKAKGTSESTPKEAAAWIGTEVSPFAIISPEEPSLDLREVEILPSNDTILKHDADKARPRTLTSKGRKYQCELKKKAALAYDRDLRVKSRSLEGFIGDCKKPDEIRMEIADRAKEVDAVVQSFDDWIDLSVGTSERQRAANKVTDLYDTWKIIHTTAMQEIKRLEDDTKSVYSRKSHRSRTSTKSGSSKSSCRETLITCRARRAALQDKLKFSTVIAEQETGTVKDTKGTRRNLRPRSCLQKSDG